MQRRALVEMPVREVLGRRAQEDPRALPLGAVVDHPHLAQAVGLKVAVGRARRGTRRRAARELAGQYPRYGYRKILIFLARRGHPMSAERTYRLWHQAGLQVPRRRPRRRVVSRRPRPLAPTAMNHVWAYDFVFDTCADGRSLKCLTVVDEFTRECLAIDVAGSIRSGRAALWDGGGRSDESRDFTLDPYPSRPSGGTAGAIVRGGSAAPRRGGAVPWRDGGEALAVA